MYNKVILLGRIVETPELKTTPNGVSVTTFRVAVDRRFQTKGEERKCDFFTCVAWRNEADFISRYWTKGKPILVEGELQNRSYTGNDGVTRYVTEVIVDRATFTGDSKQDGAASSASHNTSNATAVQTPLSAEAPTAMTSTDDDYPF